MTTTRSRSPVRGAWPRTAAAIAGLCFGSTALANPIPPAYSTSRSAGQPFVSHTRGPLLADDFVSPMNRRRRVSSMVGERNGRAVGAHLYSNTDGGPPPCRTPPAARSRSSSRAGLTRWTTNFLYAADVHDPAWVAGERADSYWFGVASYGEGWIWALGSGRTRNSAACSASRRWSRRRARRGNRCGRRPTSRRPVAGTRGRSRAWHCCSDSALTGIGWSRSPAGPPAAGAP